MAYCTTTNTRSVSGLTTSEITDVDLAILITHATRKINSDIQVKEVREEVKYIDSTRENEINGSNTEYYVQTWEKYFIGDADDDGDVDTSDVTVYQVAPGGVETELTVSSIDANNGKITLSSAPSSGNRLYITYHYSPVDMSTPHPLVVLATSYMAASLGFLRIDVKKVQQFAAGKMRVSRQSEAYTVFYDKYLETINEIKSNPLHHTKTDVLTRLVIPGFDVAPMIGGYYGR